MTVTKSKTKVKAKVQPPALALRAVNNTDLTRADLAYVLGVTPSTVFRWISGDQHLAKATGIAADTVRQLAAMKSGADPVRLKKVLLNHGPRGALVQLLSALGNGA